MKCKLTRTLEISNKPEFAEEFPDGWFPVGHILEDHECWKHVKMGNAEPADDECKERAGNMTRVELDAAAYAQTKVGLGIAAEDYEAYDNGYMVGYNGDGTWKPGPNYDVYLEIEEGEDYDDDE